MNPWDLSFRPRSHPESDQLYQDVLMDGRNCKLDNEPSSSESVEQTQSPSADRKARKKDQNRRAAYNYRRKKIEERNRVREEEMRLVYSRVCLIGYADELENTIMYILNTNSKRIADQGQNLPSFLCPICAQSCDNTSNLRTHLNTSHFYTFNP